jgi:hypothetical protein
MQQMYVFFHQHMFVLLLHDLCLKNFIMLLTISGSFCEPDIARTTPPTDQTGKVVAKDLSCMSNANSEATPMKLDKSFPSTFFEVGIYLPHIPILDLFILFYFSNFMIKKKEDSVRKLYFRLMFCACRCSLGRTHTQIALKMDYLEGQAKMKPSKRFLVQIIIQKKYSQYCVVVVSDDSAKYSSSTIAKTR